MPCSILIVSNEDVKGLRRRDITSRPQRPLRGMLRCRHVSQLAASLWMLGEKIVSMLKGLVRVGYVECVLCIA